MYIPCPVDTSRITIPEDLVKLSEELAKNTHEVWAKRRMEEGWQYGTERNDKKKETPCLVPYSDLPESEKVYDRETSRELIALIITLGYNIVKPEQGKLPDE